jgi:hypothetical protein
LRVSGHSAILLAAALILTPSPAAAQTAPQGNKLTVTVADQSGGIIPGATVTLIGLDPAAKDTTIPAAKTTDKGVVVFDNVALGRYSVRAEFAGFDMGLLRDFKINRGDNRHVVVLPLKGLETSVTVSGENQAANRSSRAFGLGLTQDEIQALSDDPAEMARQLTDIAGANVVIRVDSFEGQDLPPRSQIKSIHITRDQFAAETEQPGSTFVDVITQPGIGPIRGGANLSFRDGSMNAKSQFTPTKGPEQIRGYGFNIGGALIKDVSDFSVSINGQNSYTTPNLNVALPSGTRFDVLNIRQPFETVNINTLFDYALTRDQTLRFGYTQGNQTRSNIGVGFYDLPERAFTQDQNSYQFRVLEAGPIGRRMFINTRLTVMWRDFGSHSAIELPTIIVQDAFNSGGAQQAGRVHNKSLNFASDLDYIHGRNSWRGGVQLYADWYRANLNNNYLGTYVFSSKEAFEAGTPILYTRSTGDPSLSFFHARVGGYFQDDVRVRKGLTLSPGVRYSYQTRVPDTLAFEPRVGITWAPTKSGNTTLRLSGGIFHGWLDPGIWWQTVRFDGSHQRDVLVTNPSYPDPGIGGLVPLANTYRLGDFKLNKNLRYSAGIDQRFSPRVSVNVLYNYYHQDQLPRGTNLNPLTAGVRPDPAFANIISTVTDAEIIRHELYVNFSFSLLAPSPANARARFNWRRVSVNGGYQFISARRNGIGPFDVPASGSLATEWGHGPADNPYRVNVSLVSTQLRNLTANFSVNAADGNPYTQTTGFDDNRDGLLNDRPAGVGIWMLRTAPVWTLSGRFTYNIPLPQSPSTPGPPRYRLSVYANVNNLTNHANLTGFSGVMTSTFFMRPTAVQNPRKVDLGMNISF